MKEPQLPVISSIEVANYVVCPQAWALKQTPHPKCVENSDPVRFGTSETKSARQDWVQRQEVSFRLHHYTRFLLILLGVLVSALIVLDTLRTSHHDSIKDTPTVISSQLVEELKQKSGLDSGDIPHEIYLLLLILAVIIVIIDFFLRKRGEIQKKGGLESNSQIISIKGSAKSDQQSLVSDSLGLSAKPDALIKEKGNLIPVLIKPSTAKVRDRHVVELLVNLKLLEEQEKHAAPYGLLLMGANKKRIELKYTEEKKLWLDALLAEMRSIINDGVPALPLPSYHKCKLCDVRSACSYSAYKEDN